MGKLKNDQKGFSAIEAILILVIVGLISFVGWYTWHANKKAGSTLDQAAKSASTNPAKTTKKKAPASQPAATSSNSSQDYLVFKEWGVELPLSTGIKDAYYTNYQYAPDGSDTYAVGIHSLTTLDANCAPEKGSVSLINRQTTSKHDTNSSKDDPMNYPVYTKKIGDYYYGYDRSRAACSDNQAANDLQIATFNSFEKAFDGLKAVN